MKYPNYTCYHNIEKCPEAFYSSFEANLPTDPEQFFTSAKNQHIMFGFGEKRGDLSRLYIDNPVWFLLVEGKERIRSFPSTIGHS